MPFAEGLLISLFCMTVVFGVLIVLAVLIQVSSKVIIFLTEKDHKTDSPIE
ncbi:MAG TPA: OadG family protein [Bacillota bacterium]|nr:OadG family protein [Bacillota bacterium]